MAKVTGNIRITATAGSGAEHPLFRNRLLTTPTPAASTPVQPGQTTTMT